MKTLFIIALLFVTSTLLANELSWVDEQIEAIKPSRKGLKKEKVALLKDPFIFLHKKEEKKKEKVSSKKTSKQVYRYKKVYKKYRSLQLEATMNHSALISGKWYKLGDKVRGYTLHHISEKEVILKKHHKKITLSIKSKHKNLKLSK